jgi:peptidoglycan/xylan/chitin deacetylase (PgdA/CDA1 family)
MKTYHITLFTFYLSTFYLFTFLLVACEIPVGGAPQQTPAPTPDANAAMTQAVATVFAAITQTVQAVPASTETPVPAPTAIRTPPALPEAFTSSELNPLDTPHTYIQDACQVLKSKWDSKNAAPGTVVMPIMFHSITKGNVTEASQISIDDFRKLMGDLHDMGFEAITMQQMSDFLYNNAKIPQRSVLLIVDDRKYREYFDKTFKDNFKKWGWPVINAWISAPDTNQVLWDENAALESEGWVDHQAHGVIHNINITESSTDEYITGEMQGAIQAMQQHFNKTPIAYIWPGGSFTKRAAEMGRQFGYKLGFTINPRGPLMFNWVPLTDQADPMRPSYIPEGSVNDPLMTLPRYWDTDARAHLDTVRNISNAAAAYAEQNKATELEYYDIVCAPTYGAIP